MSHFKSRIAPSIGLAACLLAAVPAHAQDSLFAGADKFSKGSSDQTEINLDKKMLGMAGALGGDTAGLAKKMDAVFLRTYDYPSEGMYRMADVEQFRKRLEGDGWVHILKDHSATDSTDICVRTDSEGQWHELVLIDAEPKELTFIHLTGRVSLSDLGKLGGLAGGATADPKLQHRP